jgi:hypothetical protein
MNAYFTNGSPWSKLPTRTYALTLMFLASLVLPLPAQVVTVTIQGRIYDTTGAASLRPRLRRSTRPPGFRVLRPRVQQAITRFRSCRLATIQ